MEMAEFNGHNIPFCLTMDERRRTNDNRERLQATAQRQCLSSCHPFILSSCHSRRCLPQCDPAVVGGRLPVPVGAEACGP